MGKSRVVPGTFLSESLIPTIVKRLSDRSANVRQKAMDLLSAAILNNPFSIDGGNGMEFDLEKQLEKLSQMKKKLDQLQSEAGLTEKQEEAMQKLHEWNIGKHKKKIAREQNIEQNNNQMEVDEEDDEKVPEVDDDIVPE